MDQVDYPHRAEGVKLMIREHTHRTQRGGNVVRLTACVIIVAAGVACAPRLGQLEQYYQAIRLGEQPLRGDLRDCIRRREPQKVVLSEHDERRAMATSVCVVIGLDPEGRAKAKRITTTREAVHIALGHVSRATEDRIDAIIDLDPSGRSSLTIPNADPAELRDSVNEQTAIVIANSLMSEPLPEPAWEACLDQALGVSGPSPAPVGCGSCRKIVCTIDLNGWFSATITSEERHALWPMVLGGWWNLAVPADNR